MGLLLSSPGNTGWSPRTVRHRVSLLIIWLLVLAAYVAVDRPLRIVDVEGSALLPLSIWQEGDLDLDEYAAQLQSKMVVREHRGRYVASFPIWPAFQLMPVYLAVGLVNGFPTEEEVWPAQRRAAQFFMSLTTLLVGLLVARRNGRGMGILMGIAFGFGTINWFVLSQLAFTNGLVQFWLALALFLTFGRDDPVTWKAAVAFCSMVVAVFMRLHLALLVLPWMACVCLRLRRRALVPVAATALFTALLAMINFQYCGHPLGMYGRHIGSGWLQIPSLDLAVTMSANLISPARGLLIFSPWVIAALAAPLLTRSRRQPIQWILLAGWALHLLALSSHRFWHGGGSGGPRLTADLLPVLTLLAAPGIKAMLDRKRLAWIPLLLIGWSVVVAGAHAFSPPPKWESYAVPVGVCTARIFDWQDALVTFPFRDGATPYEQRFPIQLDTPGRDEVVRGPEAGFRWTALPDEQLTYEVELCVRMRGDTFLPRVISAPAGGDRSLDLDHRALAPFNPGPMSWRVAAYDRGGRRAARSGWRALWWNHGYPR